MSKRDKYSVLAMQHSGSSFYCEIGDIATYRKVISGEASIPDKCSAVKIPKSVFVSLTEGEQYIAAAEQNKLAILPCEIGDTVYWCSTNIRSLDQIKTMSNDVVTCLSITERGTRVMIDTEANGIIGSIGHNTDLYLYIGLSEDEVRSAMSLIIEGNKVGGDVSDE